ncbi:MAG: c-type cytochrome domain-containing protein [Bdellovibrionales bacterium]
MVKSTKIFFPVAILCGLMILFQNCGQGFEAMNKGDESSLGGGNPPPAPVGVAGVQYVSFKSCRVTAGATSADLASCLNTNSQNAGFTAAAIDTCGMTLSDVELAQCLSAVRPVVHNHRAPKQIEIEACNTAAGAANIADCLGTRGIQSGITQNQINTCISSATLGGVERCLRASGAIPRRVLSSSEVAVCMRAHNAGTTQILSCLSNSDLIPQGMNQAVYEQQCATANTTAAPLVTCLRAYGTYATRTVVQPYVSQYQVEGPRESLGEWLVSNGFMVAGYGFAQAPDMAARRTAFINATEGCIVSAGIGGVIRCLRANGNIPNLLTQAAIRACLDAAGQANILACLNTNFPAAAIPATLTQAFIDGCATTAGPDNIRRCLTLTRQVFSDMPTADDISNCKDIYAAGTGVAPCLDSNGLLLAGLNATQLQECLPNSTVTGAAGLTCLLDRGYIGSYQRLLGNIAGPVGSNPLLRCAACHGLAGGAGGMSIATHASIILRLVPGDPANSNLFRRINRNVAGFNPMPPNAAQALNVAEIERVRVWIAQGARNN